MTTNEVHQFNSKNVRKTAQTTIEITAVSKMDNCYLDSADFRNNMT
jgi:hypothetical protein